MASDIQKLAETLQDAELAILKALKKSRSLELGELARETKLQKDAVSRASLWLQNKKLAVVNETKKIFVILSNLGKSYYPDLPERRFWNTICKSPLTLEEIGKKAKLSEKEVQVSLGYWKSKDAILIEKGKVFLTETGKEYSNPTDEENLFLKLKDAEIELSRLTAEEKKLAEALRRRGILEQVEQKTRVFSATELGLKVSDAAKAGEKIGQLTTGMLASGSWKQGTFRRYDVEAKVPRIYPGKKQVYKAFLDEVKEELVALGFEEMAGPLVELSFFNCDALYMPQDHPARGIHDNYFVKQPRYGDLKNYLKFLSEVKKVHESGGKTGSTGWQYEFNEQESARLLLRSQTTAISARTLMSPELKIPGKYFNLARVYRPEKLDATHLTEFNQLDGMVLGEKVNFRQLLGLLADFAKKIAGIEKIKFAPSYFPFTEPSVQTLGWHEGLGRWLEIIPGGVFRPELTLPLGIKVPVLAWCIGIDRLFMIRENIRDIRQLFSDDLDWLREAKI